MTNPDENKEAFYNQLASVLSCIPRTYKILLIGDSIARIGRDNDKWPLVMRKHGIGKCNSNGELLLAMCSELDLKVTNTMFMQKDERKTTWIHPRPIHWHMIDFIITRCRDKMDNHSTGAMRGANCTPALKSDWWERKAVKLQRAADRNDMKGFYSGLKPVWGPKKKGPVHLKSTDEMETFSDSKRGVARWSEHFQKLLNVPGDIQHEALDNIPQRTSKTCLKDGKAPGEDGIPSIWKHEGDNLKL